MENKMYTVPFETVVKGTCNISAPTRNVAEMKLQDMLKSNGLDATLSQCDSYEDKITFLPRKSSNEPLETYLKTLHFPSEVVAAIDNYINGEEKLIGELFWKVHFPNQYFIELILHPADAEHENHVWSEGKLFAPVRSHDEICFAQVDGVEVSLEMTHITGEWNFGVSGASYHLEVIEDDSQKAEHKYSKGLCEGFDEERLATHPVKGCSACPMAGHIELPECPDAYSANSPKCNLYSNEKLGESYDNKKYACYRDEQADIDGKHEMEIRAKEAAEKFYAAFYSQDFYNPKTEEYAFLYNDDGAIAVYHLNEKQAKKCSADAKKSGEYWGGLLGPGGQIFDDGYEWCLDAMKRTLFEDWIDCRDYPLPFDTVIDKNGKKKFSSRKAALDYARNLKKNECEIVEVTEDGESFPAFLSSTSIPLENRLRNPIEEATREFLIELGFNEGNAEELAMEIGAELSSDLVKKIEERAHAKILCRYDDY